MATKEIASETTSSGPNIDYQTVVIVFTTLQAIVMVVASIGNLMVIVAFVRYMDMRRATNRFIINLAMSDLLTGLAMGYQIASFYVPEMSRHLVTCLLQFQTISVFTLSSQLSVTFCTIDRYIAITAPFKHNVIMSPRNTAIMISIPWVYGVVVGALPFLGVNNWTDGTACIYELVVTPAQLYLSALTTWSQTIPCFIMYGIIFKVAWERKKRIRPTNRVLVHRIEVRSSVMMGIVTVAFTACWLPFSVTTFMQVINFNPTVSFVGNCLVFVGVAHSIVNPFIYAWQKPEFRRACGRLLCPRSFAMREQRPRLKTISQQSEKSDIT
ncbi:beta-2 adrenergic receptor-like [Haliotis rubra]|uniref:beta-2 adrenergic receptor-like n=1 Tax=Haliotis rubra TaxID=36100 RepID=UPI001EE603E1|nr:beta-2 adrenergic receptor-like [Haliotis rubra]